MRPRELPCEVRRRQSTVDAQASRRIASCFWHSRGHVRRPEQVEAVQRDEQRRDERAESRPAEVSVGARHVQRTCSRESAERARRGGRRRAARRLSTRLVAIDTVSSVSPEYDIATRDVCGPTDFGVRICLSTVDRHRQLVAERGQTRRRRFPSRPCPSPRCCATPSAFGNGVGVHLPATSFAAAAARADPPTASRNFSESVVTCTLRVRPRMWVGCRRPRPSLSATVLGVVDGLRRRRSGCRGCRPSSSVAALEPRVVQRLLVGEVQQRALVVGARRGSRAAWDRAPWAQVIVALPRTIASTSAVCASHDAASGASRLRRSSGSVLLGAQVEPPVAAVDGEAVEAVLRALGVLLGDPLDHRGAGRRRAS